MKKVTSEESYWDNWRNLRDEVCYTLLDMAMATFVLCAMLVCIIPVTCLVFLGYEPDEVDDGQA